MNKLIALFIGLLAAATLAQAADFATANADYQAGHFAQAAEQYQELLKRDGPRAAVLQNLGSAHFQLGDYGQAILAFERAKLLDPGSAAIAADLKLVRERAGAFHVAEPDRWQALAARWPAHHWSLLLLAGVLLLPVTGGLWLLRHKPAAWVVGLCAVVAMGTACAAIRSLEIKTQRAIVTANPATLRLSPFATAESKGTLPAGSEVHLGKQTKAYHHIKTPDATTAGWVSEDEVEPIVPKDGK